MSERVWHKGPPPFPGWWNASTYEGKETWRWWNGAFWSKAVHCYALTENAAHRASIPDFGAQVMWTDYWPNNARVPRLDPTGGHWTFNVDGKRPSYRGAIDIAFWGGSFARRTKIADGWDWGMGNSGYHIAAWRPAA